jgi:hypothetical protein
MNTPTALCIVSSILILAFLAYNLVDRVLQHRETMNDDSFHVGDPEPEPLPELLDKSRE